MAKKPIPRFLVPTLGALALAGAFAIHASRHGIELPEWLNFVAAEPERPVILPPVSDEKAPTPRSDADLLAQHQGTPVPEILAGLLTTPTGETDRPDFQLDKPANPDPYLPTFSGEDTPETMVGDDAAVLDRRLLVSTNGAPLEVNPSSSTTGGRLLLPADFDGDGDIDLFVGRDGGLPSTLLRRGEDDAFTDITTAAGLLDFRGSREGAWVDFDRDGRLDLSLVLADPEADTSLVLYHNSDGNRFESASLRLEFPVTHLAWFDVDRDGFPDLVTSGPEGLRLHLALPAHDSRNWRFVDATATYDLDKIPGGGPLAAGDVDHDGNPELVVSGTDSIAILTADPDQPFAPLSDIATPLEIEGGVPAPGALLLEDFDNDGFLDLAVTGGNTEAPATRAWWNIGGTRLREIPNGAGLRSSHPIGRLRRIDPDGDGKASVFVAATAGKGALVAHPGPTALSGNRSVVFRLDPGDKVAARAPGARIDLVVRDDSHTLSELTVFVDETEEVVGLGKAIGIESATVTWPDREGSRTVFGHLPVDARIILGSDPDSAEATPLPHPEVVTGNASGQSDS